MDFAGDVFENSTHASPTTFLLSPFFFAFRYRQTNELAEVVKQREESERLVEEQQAPGGAKGGAANYDDDNDDSDSSFTNDEDADEKEQAEAMEREKQLRKRARDEAAHNAQFLAELVAGQHKAVVRYGAAVQLQHVAALTHQLDERQEVLAVEPALVCPRRHPRSTCPLGAPRRGHRRRRA